MCEHPRSRCDLVMRRVREERRHRRIPSAMCERPNQGARVCHSQASPKIGSTSGTKP
jgi:hypothetical protein